MEDDQADTLATGDVSKFSQLSTGPRSAAHEHAGAPAHRLQHPLVRLAPPPRRRQVINDGTEGNFKPTLLERVQPYAVYVPTTTGPGTRRR